MIAVTGASGNLGKATLENLLTRTSPTKIVAIVRDPAKLSGFEQTGIQVRTADYNDFASLENTFSGIDVLLQISSSSSGEEATMQEANVVAAAKSQNVKHIVYTSTLSPAAEAFFLAGQTCYNTEKLITESGMDYTFFRNSMYHETVPLFVGSAMEDGQIYYPTETGSVSFVSRPDIAGALAGILLNPQAGGRIFEITGSELFTFPQLANLLRQTLGLPAAFHYLPFETYQSLLEEAGLHPMEAAFYTSMARSIDAGEFATASTALEQLLGRKPVSLSAYLQSIAVANA